MHQLVERLDACGNIEHLWKYLTFVERLNIGGKIENWRKGSRFVEILNICGNIEHCHEYDVGVEGRITSPRYYPMDSVQVGKAVFSKESILCQPVFRA